MYDCRSAIGDCHPFTEEIFNSAGGIISAGAKRRRPEQGSLIQILHSFHECENQLSFFRTCRLGSAYVLAALLRWRFVDIMYERNLFPFVLNAAPVVLVALCALVAIPPLSWRGLSISDSVVSLLLGAVLIALSVADLAASAYPIR